MSCHTCSSRLIGTAVSGGVYEVTGQGKLPSGSPTNDAGTISVVVSAVLYVAI